nr:hypothetical protein [Tanacetum cinerariifolium]
MHLSGETGMVRLRNALSETRRHDSVGRLPFLDHDSMSPLEDTGSSVASGSGLVNNSDGEMLGMENVFIVNKFLHGRCYGDNDSLNITDENQKNPRDPKLAKQLGHFNCNVIKVVGNL